NVNEYKGFSIAVAMAGRSLRQPPAAARPGACSVRAMRIAVGADHAGFALKQSIAEHLRAAGHEVLDLGTTSEDRVDYPDFGAAVGRSVAGGDAELGVCVCGSGIGIAIAANKVPGVRAAT